MSFTGRKDSTAKTDLQVVTQVEVAGVACNECTASHGDHHVAAAADASDTKWTRRLSEGQHAIRQLRHRQVPLCEEDEANVFFAFFSFSSELTRRCKNTLR
jgi:hypothetical protein